MNNTHQQLINKESMASITIRHIVHASHLKSSPSAILKPKPPTFITTSNIVQFLNLPEFSSKRSLSALSKASSADSISPVDDEDGVSLGTMKLPSDTDVARFETLLFQVVYMSKCFFRLLLILLYFSVNIMHGNVFIV